MTFDQMPYKDLPPEQIEQKSFELIEQKLGGTVLPPEQAPIIKRVIHTTADFDYVDNLCFSRDALGNFYQALRQGACIVTDTQMAKAGINKRVLQKYGGEVFCFMSDEDVAKKAKETGRTRAAVSMYKAAKLQRELIFAIGNAPTALIALYQLMEAQSIHPRGIIGVPVGFVNVVEAKELILQSECPYIVAKGQKGGSNVAAALCNGLLYELEKGTL